MVTHTHTHTITSLRACAPRVNNEIHNCERSELPSLFNARAVYIYIERDSDGTNVIASSLHSDGTNVIP